MQPTILHEDDWLLAIDKPAGMAVHPGAGITGSTVNDWVRSHLGQRAVRNDFPASVAHRLDRSTSGVLLIALRRPAMRALADAFAGHQLRKEYLALVKGGMARDGSIKQPLADEEGRPRAATTRWEVLEAFEGATLVRALPASGRKHQIRRHFALLGHPLAGDTTHGDVAFNALAAKRWGLQRLFLHASALDLAHPKDGRPLHLAAPLPSDLTGVLSILRLSPAPESPGGTPG